MKSGPSLIVKTEAVPQSVAGFTARVSPADLRALREQIHLTQTEFGRELTLAINPNATRADWYTRQYISRLESGAKGFAITAQIEAAYWLIAGRSDGMVPGTAAAKPVTVLVALPTEIPEHTFIPRGAKVIKCKRLGCPVRFLRLSGGQRYHDPECRILAAEQRAAAREIFGDEP